MSNCYSKVRDWAKDKGYNIPDPMIKQMGDLLERVKADSGNYGPEQLRKDIDTLLGQWGKQQSAKFRAAEKLALSKELSGHEAISTGPYDLEKNFKHYMLGGSEKAGLESNMSPKSMQKAYLGRYTAMLRNALSDEQFKIMHSGVLNREIFQELDAIQRKTPSNSGSVEAAQIAKAIDTMNHAMFKDKKSVNPYMEKAEDFFMHRVWSRERVGMVSKDEWLSFVTEHYGEKSFIGLDPQEKLNAFSKMYDDIKAGKTDNFKLSDESRSGLMNKMAMSRVLTANNWESEFATFQRFGRPSLGEAVAASMRSSARDVSIMSKFTHDPKAFVKKLVERTFSDDRTKAESMREWANDALKNLTANNVPSNNLGKIASTLLTSQAVEHLGFSTISSWADMPVLSAMLRGVNGDSLASNMGSVMTKYASLATSPTNRADILNSIGMYSRHSVGMMNEALGFSHNAVTMADVATMAKNGQYVDAAFNGMGKIGEAYSKVNLMETHVETMRATAGLHLADALGRISKYSYGELAPELKNNLLRYGIKESEWNLIRNGTKEVENATLMTPIDIEKISDADVVKYLGNKGVVGEDGPSKSDIDSIRSEMSMRFGTMINDFADSGSSTAGAWEHNLLYGKSDINTWFGATRQFVFQFKSAALTNFRNVRRITYSGADPLKADLAGLGSYAAAAITMGVVINWTKDAIKGKTPQDPTDANFMARAFASSGMGGLYTDVLMSEIMSQNSMMGKLATYSSIAGPVIGEAVEVGSLAAGYGQAAKAELMGEFKPKAPNKQAAKYLMNKVPNIVFFKDALNFYFLNGLKESMDSGYLNKQERRVNENNALFGGQQDYFMGRPTDSRQ